MTCSFCTLTEQVDASFSSRIFPMHTKNRQDHALKRSANFSPIINAFIAKFQCRVSLVFAFIYKENTGSLTVSDKFRLINCFEKYQTRSTIKIKFRNSLVREKVRG